jgi:hypothetical protein
MPVREGGRGVALTRSGERERERERTMARENGGKDRGGK